jgi:hypothetical protein
LIGQAVNRPERDREIVFCPDSSQAPNQRRVVADVGRGGKRHLATEDDNSFLYLLRFAMWLEEHGRARLPNSATPPRFVTQPGNSSTCF